MLLSIAELRALFETDLADAQVQMLLDAAEEEIVQHAGAHSSATDYFRPREDSATLWLKRRAQSVSAVAERVGDTVTSLAAADYRLAGDRELIRLASGPNPARAWGEEVTVTYVPVSDLATRKRVQADLVKLAAQYQAVAREISGDLEQQFPEYQAERERILSALRPRLALA